MPKSALWTQEKRIELLLDEGAFEEYEMYATHRAVDEVILEFEWQTLAFCAAVLPQIALKLLHT